MVFAFSYVMGTVHSKVFSVVKETYERDDKLLFTKSRQLHNVTAEQLGVNKKIACPLPQAVSLNFLIQKKKYAGVIMVHDINQHFMHHWNIAVCSNP